MDVGRGLGCSLPAKEPFSDPWQEIISSDVELLLQGFAAGFSGSIDYRTAPQMSPRVPLPRSSSQEAIEEACLLCSYGVDKPLFPCALCDQRASQNACIHSSVQPFTVLATIHSACYFDVSFLESADAVLRGRVLRRP
eukprot:6092552-Amphidinium_carterae.1